MDGTVLWSQSLGDGVSREHGRESSKKNTTRVQGEINSVFFSTSLEIAEDKQNVIFSDAIFVVSFLSFFSNKNSQELQWLP